jgi:hypothetical protein
MAASRPTIRSKWRCLACVFSPTTGSRQAPPMPRLPSPCAYAVRGFFRRHTGALKWFVPLISALNPDTATATERRLEPTVVSFAHHHAYNPRISHVTRTRDPEGARKAISLKFVAYAFHFSTPRITYFTCRL